MEDQTPEEKRVIRKKPKSPSRLKSITTNPYIFIALAILSVLGFGFAVFTWIDSKANRELTYFVNPARAVVVQSGKSSDIKVSYKNDPVPGDITAAQVAIWNAGKLSIKNGDVLAPLVISTQDGIPILEASIRQAGRDVSQISLDRSELKEGRLIVTWAILEKNDGTVIQLIYAGNPETKISAHGTLEGQNSIIHAARDVSQMNSTLRYLLLGVYCFFFLGSIANIIAILVDRKKSRFFFLWLLSQIFSVFFFAYLAFNLIDVSPSVPFVFD